MKSLKFLVLFIINACTLFLSYSCVEQTPIDELRELKLEIDENYENFTGEDWNIIVDRLTVANQELEENHDLYTNAQLQEAAELNEHIISGPGGSEISRRMIGNAWDNLMNMRIGDIFGQGEE